MSRPSIDLKAVAAVASSTGKSVRELVGKIANGDTSGLAPHVQRALAITPAPARVKVMKPNRGGYIHS